MKVKKLRKFYGEENAKKEMWIKFKKIAILVFK